MKISYKKEIYSKRALLKAAYHFTDRYYVHLDADNEYYYVELSAKESIENIDIEQDFKNEMLAQATREAILEKTSDLRELILARAFASTIIEDSEISGAEKVTAEHDENNYDEDVADDSIFEDWYSINEE